MQAPVTQFSFSLRFPAAEETFLQEGLHVVAQVLLSHCTVTSAFPLLHLHCASAFLSLLLF